MIQRHFSLFLALRYLRPKRVFLLVISIISILGVGIGVAVPIIVLSVMTGFERELEDKVTGSDAHIVIAANGILDNWQPIREKVLKTPDVLAAAPFVQGPVMIEFRNRRVAPKIRAIDPELERQVTDINKYIVEGRYDLDGEKVLVGSALAQELGIQVGDVIHLYSPGNIDDMLAELDRLEKSGDKTSAASLKQMILPKDLEVTGVFESGRYSFDSEFLIVPLYVGQETYNIGDAIHGMAVRTTDRNLAAKVSEQLNRELKPPVYAITWMEMNHQIFMAITTERTVMLFILFFISIVAAFGIMNTLITVTVQKTRDIGILKALGARTPQIIGIFFIQGIIVGVIGILGGLVAAIAIVQYRNDVSSLLRTVFHIDVFPRAIYEFSSIPAQIVFGDVVIVCIGAFIICAIASLIPSWIAARLDPVKALRYE